MPTPRGQASYKPRGRKSQHAPVGPGRLIRYGDSIVRSPCGCGDRVAQPEGSIARMLDGDDARLDSGMTQRARDDASAAKGKAAFRIW